jgi:putative tricarboxylic transport membrane protein
MRVRFFFITPLVVFFGCSQNSTTENDYLINEIEFVAPASPGGGWDQTARLIQEVLLSEDIINTSQVINIPGAGGTIGLARLATDSQDRSMKVMLSGLIMMGATITNNSPLTLDDTIPIARLLGEYEVLVVPANSPFSDLASFLREWKADPGSFPVAGGSAGGTDHMVLGLLALDQQVDPKVINYLPHSGGGESLAAILGGHVEAGINGYGELRSFIESGRVRALAISSPIRLEGVNIPTFLEQGVDIELANWRSLIASPHESDENIKTYIELARRLNELDAWSDVLIKNNWTNLFLADEEFKDFLVYENQRVINVLSSIGLIND